MNGEGTIALKGSPDTIFSSLLDPEVLKNCIMGCKNLDKQDEETYKANLSVGIAAIKGKYDATIRLTDVQSPNHYKLIVHGEGAPGFVDADADIDLTLTDEKTTELRYSYNADVGGKVASIGQRMLGGVAKLIIKDFFKKMKQELEKVETAE
jgi:carbon monoxide dehydrogenase subunit G